MPKLQSFLLSALLALVMFLHAATAHAQPRPIQLGSITTVVQGGTFSIAGGTPLIEPYPVMPGQTVTARFRVTIAPPSNSSSIQQQRINLVDANDGTIKVFSAPGFTSSIDADTHAATLTRSGGAGGTFDVTAKISYPAKGFKLLSLSGTAFFSNGGATSDAALLAVNVGSLPEPSSVETTAAVAPRYVTGPRPTLTELSPAIAKVLAQIERQGGKAAVKQALTRGIVMNGVVRGTAAPYQVVIIAAGAAATVDLVVYVRTGKAKGPFTKLGTFIGSKYRSSTSIPANTQSEIQLFCPEGTIENPAAQEYFDAAKYNAKYNGRTYCQELAVMLEAAKRRGDTAARDAIVGAQQLAGCYAESLDAFDVALGLNRGLQDFAHNRKAVYFANWESVGINSDKYGDTPGQIRAAMRQAKTIHFKLDGFPRGTERQAAMEGGAKGPVYGYYTKWELHLILTNSAYRNKTRFYRNGKQVASPF